MDNPTPTPAQTTEMTQSFVSPSAQVGDNLQIGHGTVIYGSSIIEENCNIGDHCVIGHPANGSFANRPARLGVGSVVRSHTVIYEGTELGPKLETGHHVLIREGTIAGKHLRIGSYSDVEGDCLIGDFCRFHSYTHVGRGSKIGNFVWLYSLTTLANDPLPPSEIFAPVVVEDAVVVCIGSTILAGTVLRKGCYVTAHTVAQGEIPSGAVVSGPLGQVLSHVSLLADFQRGIRHPWMSHFTRGYPSEALPRLNAIREAILTERGDFIRKYLARRV